MANSNTRALARFEQAVRDHEMLGAQPPEDHLEIQQRYENTKADIIRRLKGTTNGKA